MTARNAVVLIDGQLQELPSGDTLNGAAGGGGGSAAIYQVTLDFGATSVTSKSFSFADANALTSSKIVMSVASPDAGRQFDELEMDGLICAAACLIDGTISVALTAHPGPVTGQYTFNYLIG